jgi:adenylate cyclase
MVAKASVTAVDIIEWLASDECHAYDGARLIGALAAMLGDCGLPVQRLVFHLRVPHPTIFGRSIAWAPGEPVAFLDIEHGVERSERIRTSPVLHVMSTRDWLVLRMDDRRRWTLHDIFTGRGLTELCFAPLLHDAGEGPSSAVTFGTQKPDGFSPAGLDLLRRIMPALRGALELKMWRRTTETMLDTYIGSDAEKRILSGRVRRGDIETLEAALMFCDMQGFTELSNRLSTERVLEVLNAYFDEVVPAIAQHGGQVLKFMGDGLLAFFRDAEGAGPSCVAALKAAPDRPAAQHPVIAGWGGESRHRTALWRGELRQHRLG